MSARRSVLIIRPDPAARRTAALLSEQRFEPFVLPLSVIRPVRAAFPDKSYDAVIATSANAFLRPLPHDAAFLAGLPLYCAGSRTARAARRQGFTSIIAIARNVDSLYAEIWRRQDRRFVYLAGRLRRPVLENRLRQMEAAVDSVEVYETRILTPSAVQQAALPQPVDFILLYSAGSIGMLASLAGVITTATALICLSPRIAAALPGTVEGKVQVAAEPTEKALFSLLARL